MAGLEIVVRPLIFPDIRPAKFRPALAPEDDPTKGFAVIQGDPTVSTSSSYSVSISGSFSHPKEKQRRVDHVRIYQIEEPKGAADGGGGGGGGGDGVNKDNYVDMEVANRITMGEGSAETTPGGLAEELRNYYYQRVSEESNIEILRRNIIKDAE